MTAGYPTSPSARNRWILKHRGPRNGALPERAYAAFSEMERSAEGALEEIATVFLTNKECPWKCVMCDLWRNTTVRAVSPESIVQQIQYALEQFPDSKVLKLYNSGSFFDSGAIPRAAWREIAVLCRGFRHLIVECHPRLIGPRVLDFAAMLPCSLEIAIGLETAHPVALEKLNKRITESDYQRAAEFLRENGISLRTFLLVNPPFLRPAEQDAWMARSIDVATKAGSAVVSLIPLRAGNGAVEMLIATGEAHLPRIEQIENAQQAGLTESKTRVFADTWDLRLFSRCEHCFEARLSRIERMNLSQKVEPSVRCDLCGHG